MTSEPAAAAPVASREGQPAGSRFEIEPHNCFACGSLNTNGLQLELHTAAGRCWAEIALPARFEGWEGIAHGGVVCTILDEVMAWALIEHDAWGLTARLNVDFKRPVRIGVPVRAEGWVVEVRRRLLTTASRLIDPQTGDELATGEATYVAAPDHRKQELKARYRFRYVPEDGSATAQARSAAALAAGGGN